MLLRKLNNQQMSSQNPQPQASQNPQTPTEPTKPSPQSPQSPNSHTESTSAYKLTFNQTSTNIEILITIPIFRQAEGAMVIVDRKRITIHWRGQKIVKNLYEEVVPGRYEVQEMANGLRIVGIQKVRKGVAWPYLGTDGLVQGAGIEKVEEIVQPSSQKKEEDSGKPSSQTNGYTNQQNAKKKEEETNPNQNSIQAQNSQ